MADETHLQVLRKGVKEWNEWRKSEFAPDLSGANLQSENLHDANLWGTNLTRANLRRAHLTSSNLHSANLSGADLRNANLQWARLDQANLSNADLSQAIMSEVTAYWTNLQKANLTGVNLAAAQFFEADLSGADLTNASLFRSHFVKCNLQGALLIGCTVYGIAAWDLQLDGATQRNLHITYGGGPAIAVDDIEIAQFIHLLINHKKIRSAINSIAEKGVLILGRFGGGGLTVLQSLAVELRDKGYLPIIFDFERPSDRDYTETIQTLAGLSRFVIVDLSGPSVPQELYATIPHIKIPYVPIIEKGKKIYALFAGLLQYQWVVKPVVEFTDEKHLIKILPDRIIAPAEDKHKERRVLLRQLFDSEG